MELRIGMFDLFEKSRDMGVGGTHLYTLPTTWAIGISV